MRSTGLAKVAKTRLGLAADCAAWCRISKIPEPPAEVRKAAGGAPVRPAFIRPLGMLGVALVAVLWPFGALLALLASLEDLAEWLLSSKERARARARARDDEERKKAIKDHALDQLFDGNWTATAGQLLLRWYGHSSHPKRLLVLTPDRIVLAAPPKRVSVRQAERMVVVAEIPTSEARVEDPLLGVHPSDRLRIVFSDGSWLTVITDEERSDIHKHLMRLPRLGSSSSRSVDIIDGESGVDQQR
ncbi:hypothetical protein RVN83_20555 [Streptomyces sp. PU10]|uniref:hypothetical protein n=1 Tax=unclassified Streptomyces TaxID=2593676 RepID=UPI0028FC69BB|nr:hypothetical protein [Streptomyces sp. PU10]MDU0255482.1 hypothetical protein [Streptomyces sp. PU10]WSU02075.1 hypothetical protein OG368_16270 [Streptomyces sp. NBC_01124]